jgi:hypothetical protein
MTMVIRKQINLPALRSALTLKWGYIISEKFAVGAELYFGITKKTTILATETIEKSTTIGIAPFARLLYF